MIARPILLATLLLTVAQDSASQTFGWRRSLNGDFFTVGRNPHNPNTLYASTLDSRFLVSHDRGIHWTVLDNTAEQGIRQIVVHPNDTTVLFRAGFSNGLYRSTNSGSTWSLVISGYGIDGEAIAYDPVHPDTMYAGRYGGGNVYRSTNRGASWSTMGSAGPDLCALAVRPDSGSILYAGTGGGTISKSTNAGATWRMVKPQGSDEIPRIVVDPVQPRIAYGAGFSGPANTIGVWKTTDGGESWGLTSLAGVSIWALDMDIAHPEVVYAGSFGEAIPAVYKTTDGGISWVSLESGLHSGDNIWSLKAHPLDSGSVVLASSGNATTSGIYSLRRARGSIHGVVRDERTGEAVTNGRMFLPQQEFVNLGATGGAFFAGYFDGDPTVTPTVQIEAYPYRVTNVTLTFIPDSNIALDVMIPKLSTTAVTGVCRDSITHAPVQARITLSGVSSTGPVTFEDTTDAAGEFLLDGLFISQPPVLRYTTVRARPSFPYPERLISNPTLDSAGLHLQLDAKTADILVGSPASGERFSSFYLSILDSLGVSYYFWRPSQAGVPPLRRGKDLKKHTVIYWTAFADSLSSDERDSLSSCIEAGCNLLLTGHNIVQRNDSTRLVNDLLGVRFGGNSTIASSRGIDGDLFAGLFFSISGSIGLSDILVPNTLRARPVMRYGASDSGSISTVRIDTAAGGGRAMLFGFGLESVNNVATRTSLLQRTLEYFDGTIILDVDDRSSPDLPEEFSLGQNFPNPFNPVTTMEYSVAKASVISLMVFNVLGEHVATLVQGLQAHGTYRVSWSAEGCGSGVYFCRMQAGGFSQTRKLLLLR